MKTIIVATDYSTESTNALDFAIAAAADRQFKLVVFNLQQISVHTLNARVSSDSVNQDMKVKENRLINLCKEINAKHQIETLPFFATGDFFEAMNMCLETTNGDVLILGMREKTLEQELVGNLTTAAIAKLKIPILAIPSEAKYKGIKNIVFACDVLKGVYVKVLDRIKTVAQKFDAHVTVFHVANTVEKMQQSETQFDKEKEGLTGVSYFYKSVLSDRIIDAISEEVKNSNADILIMIPQKYGFWGSMVHTSKTRIMALANHIPLLTIPVK